MEEKIKSGKEMLDDFFTNIREFQNVDQRTSQVLSELYKNDKFTANNILNNLYDIREEITNDKNK